MVISSLLIYGCRKVEIPKSGLSRPQEIDYEKVNAVQSMQLQEGKLAYRLLNESEKSIFWTAMIDNFLFRNPVLSLEARSLVTSLVSHIKPEIFRINSNENILFKDQFVPNWLTKAEKLLNTDLITALAYGPVNKIHSPYENLKTSPTPSPSCACNLGSRYDCAKTTVHVGTNGLWYEEVRGACVNAGNECTVSTLGCGFFWLYSCNGSTCVF